MTTDRARPSGRRPSPRPTTARATSGARNSSAKVASRSARSAGRPATAAATATALREHVEPKRPSLELLEARRSRRRLRIAGVATSFLVFGSMLGLAAFHSVLVQGQLHLDRLDTAITNERERENALRLQVAQLGTPERIRLAAGEQGMVPPDDRKFLAAVIPGSVVPPPVTTKTSASTPASASGRTGTSTTPPATPVTATSVGATR